MDNNKNSTKNNLNIESYLERINNFKSNVLEILFDFLGDSINENTKAGILEKLNDRFTEVTTAYSITEHKFKYRQRDSGEMYITHINGVLDIYMNYLFNLNEKLDKLDRNQKEDRKKAIEYVKDVISILSTIIEHDSIEDTDATMEGINQRLTNNKLVGFTTLLLSKKPFFYYIDNDEDSGEYKKIKQTGILNEKGLISDRVKKKIKISEGNDEELVRYTVWDDHALSKIELDGLKKYGNLEKKYKKIRNEQYIIHYKSVFSLMKYAKKLLNEKNISFSDDDFKIIIYNTILIKLADRIHNLNDIIIAWKNSPKRIERKLVETEKHLLPLAMEFSPEIYNYLERKIYFIRQNNIINTVNNSIDNSLGK